MTLTPIAERLAVELSLPVFTTYVCCGWESNTQPSACGANALTYYATAAVESLVFCREKYMLSTVFSKLSYYINCITHTFHINGIENKTHDWVSLISSYYCRLLNPDLHLQPWKYMRAREYTFLSYAPRAYRYNKEKSVRNKDSVL